MIIKNKNNLKYLFCLLVSSTKLTYSSSNFVLMFILFSCNKLKVFKQKCVCEQCYQNKGDIDILKCVVCRT